MAVRRAYSDVHVIDRAVLSPTVSALTRIGRVLGRMHVGNVNAYAAYVLLAAIAALLAAEGPHALRALLLGLGLGAG